MTTDDQLQQDETANDVNEAGENGELPEDASEFSDEVSPVVEVGQNPQLESELAEWKDRHLRLAAEFENYRKRTAREKTETWSRAQADIVGSILDALDDFSRVLETDSGAASTEDVIKGVELVERKLMRELTSAGLEKVGIEGESFDPNLHEAIGSQPAETEAEDHTVGAVFQVGYRFGGSLLRPAKVQVRLWQDGGAG